MGNFMSYGNASSVFTEYANAIKGKQNDIGLSIVNGKINVSYNIEEEINGETVTTTVVKPLLLDETGASLVSGLNAIAAAIVEGNVVCVSQLPQPTAECEGAVRILTSAQLGYEEGGIYKCEELIGSDPVAYSWNLINASADLVADISSRLKKAFSSGQMDANEDSILFLGTDTNDYKKGHIYERGNETLYAWEIYTEDSSTHERTSTDTYIYFVNQQVTSTDTIYNSDKTENTEYTIVTVGNNELEIENTSQETFYAIPNSNGNVTLVIWNDITPDPEALTQAQKNTLKALLN